MYVATNDDFLARSVVWPDLKRWERGTIIAISERARGGGLFVDVGAYSGIYCLLWLAEGPGTAVAFEPNPGPRALLEGNATANGFHHRLEISASACGKGKDRGWLGVPVEDPTAARVEQEGGDFEVEIAPLDDLIGDRDVSLIKVDVEGLEPDVLEGAKGLLQRSKPDLILECLDNESYQRVNSILVELGYMGPYHLSDDGPSLVDSFQHIPRSSNYMWTVRQPCG